MKVLPEKYFYKLNPTTNLLEMIDEITGEVLAVQSSPDVDLLRLENKHIVQVKTRSGKLVWTERGLAPKVKGQKNSVWRFSKAWSDLITQAVADGEPLHRMGKPHVFKSNALGKNRKLPNPTANFPPASVIYRWRAEHAEFDAEIKRAIKIRADYFAGQVMETAENAKEYNAKGSRVKMDGYKWLAAVSDPDTYGNKTKISGDADQPVTFLIDTGIRRGDATALAQQQAQSEPKVVEGTTLEQKTEHTTALPPGEAEVRDAARAAYSLMAEPDLLAAEVEDAHDEPAGDVLKASGVEVGVSAELPEEIKPKGFVRTSKRKRR